MHWARRSTIVFGIRRGHRHKRSILFTLGALFLVVASVANVPAGDVDFVSDRNAGITLQHSQQWGDFGFDTAAARTGTVGSQLRIGEKTFDKGLGHHANGEIVIDLRGQYSRFRAWIGVQWQGGGHRPKVGRGSVVFRVSVDGNDVFKAGPMSDSDPPKEVDVPLAGARELCLIASDAGDGIACDMANWAEACLVRDLWHQCRFP